MVAVKLETGETYYSVVPEGVYEGQPTQIGGEATVDIGNVIPLGKIPINAVKCWLFLNFHSLFIRHAVKSKKRNTSNHLVHFKPFLKRITFPHETGGGILLFRNSKTQ